MSTPLFPDGDEDVEELRRGAAVWWAGVCGPLAPPVERNMAELSEYQARVAGLLGAGWRLERRLRRGEFGRRWPVVVLVDGAGVVGESVRWPTIERLIEAGVLRAEDIVDGTDGPLLGQTDVSTRGRLPDRRGNGG
jgi:hypothetical protein